MGGLVGSGEERKRRRERGEEDEEEGEDPLRRLNRLM